MKYFLSIAILTFSLSLWSHEGGHHEQEQTWKIGNQIISGEFLLLKDGIVYLQTEDGATKKIPLNEFTTQDQAQINHRYQTIEKLNTNNGKEVFHSHHFEQAIDLSLQPKGIYFLVIKTSKGEFKQKLILQ